MTEFERIAKRVRKQILIMSSTAKAPHVASALSCVEILVALYFKVANVWPERPDAPERDRILLSKGHGCTALYACLAERGFFPVSRLAAYANDGSSMGLHPVRGALPGVEASTGSLGHGLGLGIGMAVAARMDRTGARVFTVLSDGECNEGSVWEAALWAPAHNLDNLVAVIDFNKLQATGRSTELTCLSPLPAKWEAFGWDVSEIDGHDLRAVTEALESPPDRKPRAVIAHTVKGKGVSFMEDETEWHYSPPSPNELERALAELEEVP